MTTGAGTPETGKGDVDVSLDQETLDALKRGEEPVTAAGTPEAEAVADHSESDTPSDGTAGGNAGGAG